MVTGAKERHSHHQLSLPYKRSGPESSEAIEALVGHDVELVDTAPRRDGLGDNAGPTLVRNYKDVDETTPRLASLPTSPGVNPPLGGPHGAPQRLYEGAGPTTGGRSAGGKRDGDGPLVLTTTVWKRRSRFTGKLTARPRAAWERRRLTLQGSQLMYYKSTAEACGGASDEREYSDEEGESEVAERGRGRTHPEEEPQEGISFPHLDTGLAVAKLSSKKTFYQTARNNLRGNLKTARESLSSSSAESNFPRGVLDIDRENATVSASTAHSGAPTPYCISVKVKGVTRWKLSFDTHVQQTEWLTVLTDVVVDRSVANYNAVSEKTVFERSHFFRQTSFEEYVSKECQKNIDAAVLTVPNREFSYNVDQNCPGTSALDTATATSEFPRRMSDGIIIADGYWIIPRNNFFVMLMLVDGALAYFQSTPLLPTKHLILVTAFVNAGLYLCLVREAKRCPLARGYAVQDLYSHSFTNQDPLNSSLHAGTPINRSIPKETPEEELDSLSTKRPDLEKNAPIASEFKPVAGSTSIQIQSPTDPAVNANDLPFVGWRATFGSAFQVRSHGYMSTKEKVSSPLELYQLVNVDVFESKGRVPNMSKKVTLPNVEFGVKKGNWKSPDIFVVSLALPTEAPRIGRSAASLQGYMVTMYYVMKEETREMLHKITLSNNTLLQDETQSDVDVQKRIINGVRLWERWCQEAPTDHKMQGRFKVLVDAHNLAEIGVPSWIAKYNGKPFLIKRSGVTGFLYDSSSDSNVMEFDISFFEFPYLFKQATAYMKEHYFKKVLASFAFCIEGRDDNELPEVTIGNGIQLCYPDPDIAIHANDLFTGKSPSSFDPIDGH